MKKSDLTAIILIASLSMMVAFFIAKAILGDVYNGSATVKTADPISSEIVQPDPSIFNKNAINPTINIRINGPK